MVIDGGGLQRRWGLTLGWRITFGVRGKNEMVNRLCQQWLFEFQMNRFIKTNESIQMESAMKLRIEPIHVGYESIHGEGSQKFHSDLIQNRNESIQRSSLVTKQ